MPDLLLICVGWALIAVGVIGCIVPMLPGPPIAFVALLVARTVGDSSVPSLSLLLTAAAITVVVTILDYVVPAFGAKKFNCSKLGVTGCLIGTVVGLFFLPFGVILGPFFGALIGESISGKNLGQALVGAFGAFLGYVFGIVIKLACCGYVAWCFYDAVK